MNNPYNLFESQYKKAKETLDLLKIQKAEINYKLESNFASASSHKELRTVNMEIKITENEMEHAQYRMKEYESKYNSSEV
jgi:hypothetical protein